MSTEKLIAKNLLQPMSVRVVEFNDSYSQNDSIIKFLPSYPRKRYNPYSKNDNSTYEGAFGIIENALTMGVFVY